MLLCSFALFFFLTAQEMGIDYIFSLRIFSSKKSARAKILTEWRKNFETTLTGNVSISEF